MNHFLEISQFSEQELKALLNRAIELKKTKHFPQYPQYTVANLFYENSTRTRVSFELAAKRLGMTVVNLDLQHSSEAKGEHIKDTIFTLAAMDIKLFVIRHRQDGIQKQLAETLPNSTRLINAGDGQNAHPSQAMLDLMTIIEKKPDLASLKIAIVGNIRHSRVANSLQNLCKILKIGNLSLVAPDVWQPHKNHFGQVTTSLKEGLTDADVVICLRVQQERLLEADQLDLQTYRKDYALTLDTLTYAKKDAIVMHPGPINRGIEIDSDVADGKQSCILQQVTNGVFMRMAILESLVVDK